MSTGTSPANRAYAFSCPASPKKSRPAATPIRGSAISGRAPSRPQGSCGTRPRATRITRSAVAASGAKTETQSSDRHAGTTPSVLSSPRVGLTPTIPLSAAGTRPDPAVSVPSAKATLPPATATAEPELDPPAISPPPKTLSGVPYGERVPVSPVANWSRFVLPATIAPASTSRRTTGALRSGAYAKSGQPAVVGSPATSMLSLTANSIPASGSPGSISPARACSSSAVKVLIQTPSAAGLPRNSSTTLCASTSSIVDNPVSSSAAVCNDAVSRRDLGQVGPRAVPVQFRHDPVRVALLDRGQQP